MIFVTIEDWLIFDFKNFIYVYKNDDLTNSKIIGKAFLHPRFINGTLIESSIIKRIDKNIVFTANSAYILGKPSSSYLDYLRKSGYNDIDEIENLK